MIFLCRLTHTYHGELNYSTSCKNFVSKYCIPVLLSVIHTSFEPKHPHISSLKSTTVLYYFILITAKKARKTKILCLFCKIISGKSVKCPEKLERSDPIFIYTHKCHLNRFFLNEIRGESYKAKCSCAGIRTCC